MKSTIHRARTALLVTLSLALTLALTISFSSCSKENAVAEQSVHPDFSKSITQELGEWNSAMSPADFNQICLQVRELNIPLTPEEIYGATPMIHGRPAISPEVDYRLTGQGFITQEKLSGSSNYRSNLPGVLFMLNHYNQTVGVDHPLDYTGDDGQVRFADVMVALAAYGNTQDTDFNPDFLDYGDTTMYSVCTFLTTYTAPLTVNGTQVSDGGFTAFVHCTPDDEQFDPEGYPIFPLSSYRVAPVIEGVNEILVIQQ